MGRGSPLLTGSLEIQGQHVGGLEVAYSLESALREGMETPGASMDSGHLLTQHNAWDGALWGFEELQSEDLCSGHKSTC